MFKIIALAMFVFCYFPTSSWATVSVIKKDGVENKDVESVKITYIGVIGEKSISELISALDEIRMTYPELKKIFLYIHSAGGDMHSGYLAYEVIKNSMTPITTINLAYVASSATMLYCAGKNRLVMPLAHFTLHSASTHYTGDLQPDQIEQLKQSVGSSNALFRNIYKQCTNYSDKEIDNILFSENNNKQLDANSAIDKRIAIKKTSSIEKTPVSYYLLSEDGE